MYAPLSANMQMKVDAHNAKKARDQAAAESKLHFEEQQRALKLRAEEAKINQDLRNKQQLHVAKLKDLGAPLGKALVPPQVTVPSLDGGFPPPAPGNSPKDTVPSYLEPGEAVIPKDAAQDPANKAAIARMVNGSDDSNGYADGTTNVQKKPETMLDMAIRMMTSSGQVGKAVEGIQGRKSRLDQAEDEAVNGKKAKGYADGSTNIGGDPYDEQLYQRYGDVNQAPQLSLGEPSNDPRIGVPAPQNTYVVPPKVAPNYSDSWTQSRESGGNPAAKNPNSSASGLYQMTNAAWKDAIGINPELAKLDKSNPQTQQMGRDAYKKVLANQLTARGIEPSEAAIAKAWVVGAGGLSAITKGDPNAPLSLSKEAIAINPNLQGKTNSDFLNDPDPYSRKGKGSAVPAIAGKPSPYDVKVVSPNWFTGENPDSPNAAMRAQGSFPVEVNGKVVDANAVAPKAAAVPPVAGAPQQSEAGVPPAKPVDVNFGPQQEGKLSQFAQENQQYIAKAQAEAAKIADPVEKKSFLENALSSLFGKTGLFNEQELMRFAIVGAGGMLTGGSIGGSLRFAAKDVLNTSDARRSAEAQDERQIRTQEVVDRRSERNRLLALNYSPAQVDAYLASKNKDAKLLGDPVLSTEDAGDAPRSVTPVSGQYMDQEIKLTKRTTKQGSTVRGSEWGAMIGGKWVPESQLDSVIGRTTKWEAGTHSRDARAKQLDEVQKTVTGNVKDMYDIVYAGDKNKVGMKGLPAASDVGRRAINTAKDLGFDIRDPDQKAAMQDVIANATKKMVEAHQNNIKVNSIDQFIHGELIQSRTGLDSGAFMLKDDKMMGAEKIKQLTDKASRSIKEGQSMTDLMTSMYAAYKANPAIQKKYGAGAEKESGFYRYASDKLNEK